MVERIQPWSKTSELAVIGGAIVNPSLLPDLCRLVTDSDFREPAHSRLFAAIEKRHHAGDRVDASLLAADVAADVTDPRTIISDAIVSHGSSEATLTHARVVADLAVVRRIEEIASHTLVRIRQDGASDPAQLLDTLGADIASVHLPNDPRPLRDVWVGADLLAEDFPEPAWVVPGLLREGWRLLFVGMEGGGKSTMLRQIAVGAATGQHPFGDGTFDPVPAVIVDCENPASVVRDGLGMMRHHVEQADLTIMSRPGGIDLRSRSDRDDLWRLFESVRPKVCSIGPLYKLYRGQKGESEEQSAIAAQNILDDLRVAFGCALILETHAPKGSTLGRELIPFGSSAWMRWPELGWKLVPCDDRGEPDKDGRNVKIGHFRGDRVQVEIPRMFQRGKHGTWPWSAVWDRNVYRRSA